MVEQPRTGAERKADVTAKLEAPHADTWVATAAPSAVAHLVPLSFAWDERHIILATEPASVTARNLQASGQARLAFGATRDVVMVDAVLDAAIDLEDVPPALADAYARQAAWDPRGAGGVYVYFLLRPRRIQAWCEANELSGRTVMRDGGWLV